MKKALVNANLIMPDYIIRNATLIIEDGKIADFGKKISTEGAEIMDMKGAYIGPGLIDIHTHADGETFWGFNVVTAGDGSTFSLTVRGGIDDGKCFTEGITLRQRDWYNLRVEYGFTSGDEVEIKVYVDGMLTATYTSSVAADKDATLGRVQLYHVDSINNATINLDNTIITSVKAD